MTSTFTTSDGCRLLYQAHGFQGFQEDGSRKPVVVFLNGTTQTALMWRPQALFLKKDFRVVCYDGRAQGRSDLGNRALSLDLHVADLYSLLAFLQIGSAHLVGLSHGGQLALAFASRYPEKTQGLIVCGIGYQPEPRTRAIIRSWLKILATGSLETMAWAALPTILGATFLGQNEKLLPKMVNALVARNRIESLLAHLEAQLAYPPPSDSASRIPHPCLVISGSDDLLSPPASAKRLAEMIHADYAELDQIGHSVPVEAAERFNRLCRRFLMQRSAL